MKALIPDDLIEVNNMAFENLDYEIVLPEKGL